MKELSKKELLNINGGASNLLSTAFFTAISKAVTTLLDLGRSLGTAIRSSISGNVCQF